MIKALNCLARKIFSAFVNFTEASPQTLAKIYFAEAKVEFFDRMVEEGDLRVRISTYNRGPRDEAWSSSLQEVVALVLVENEWVKASDINGRHWTLVLKEAEKELRAKAEEKDARKRALIGRV